MAKKAKKKEWVLGMVYQNNEILVRWNTAHVEPRWLLWAVRRQNEVCLPEYKIDEDRIVIVSYRLGQREWIDEKEALEALR
jgi:hypothetical protein